VDGLRDTWWEVELVREWGGAGIDTACGVGGTAAVEEMDAAAPRRVTVTRHGA